jgi:hypothetical protein
VITSVTSCVTVRYVIDDLWWREEDAAYIRARATRYPGAAGIEVSWTLEAAADPRGIVETRTRKAAAVRSGSSGTRRAQGS